MKRLHDPPVNIPQCCRPITIPPPRPVIPPAHLSRRPDAALQYRRTTPEAAKHVCRRISSAAGPPRTWLVRANTAGNSTPRGIRSYGESRTAGDPGSSGTGVPVAGDLTGRSRSVFTCRSPTGPPAGVLSRTPPALADGPDTAVSEEDRIIGMAGGRRTCLCVYLSVLTAHEPHGERWRGLKGIQ